jgi:hypothetical protein
MSAQTIGTISTSHTVYIFQDFFETVVLSDLLDYLRRRVCGQLQHPLPQIKTIQHALKPTPMRVNMMSCEITKNAK